MSASCFSIRIVYAKAIEDSTINSYRKEFFMKRIKLFTFAMFVVMTGSAIGSEQNMVCKDGVCSYDPNKHTIKPQQEASVKSQTVVIELTGENFESFVKNSTKPVIVDFYATWCQPCTAIKPLFAELAKEEQNMVFAAIDGDKNRTIAAQCGVRAFPSFVIFKNGVQWGKIEGGMPKDQLITEFKKIVDLNQPMTASQAEILMGLLMAISGRDLEAIKKSIASGVDLNGTVETPQGTLSAMSVAIITRNRRDY